MTTVCAGFGMPRIALRLQYHLGHHIRGVDLSTLFSSNTSAVRKVDTRHIRKDVLLRLSTLLRQTDILARAVPRVTNTEHESYEFDKDGKMKLQNARYKSRVRVSKQVRMPYTNFHSGRVYQGRAVRAKGKATYIAFRKGSANNFSTFRVVGLDEPTPAEKARDALILRVLQDTDELLEADFIRFLWFMTSEDEASLCPSPEPSTCRSLLKPEVKKLNPSQAKVVEAMTCHDPVVIVHGPPGTGKTTTISSAAAIWSKRYSLPVWIIGHSNVSVKNIAEKLLKEDVDFKLIVSKEFYVEWHEHIYEKMEQKLIRSDELPDNRLGMSRLIGSSIVILSTLGLLSNPSLERGGLFDVVPFERLVVDEASQINVIEYMVRTYCCPQGPDHAKQRLTTAYLS
ncbi:P-loop containing nucleoside triphosphate hydrolase protein [Lentinula aciculospora]|uniref:P-loop containing nucleoside triphosphate hydrolase protein n=1 Tax=Lentinula aciculospora TaxID=153920 RepID=A0A9W9DN37_9AGAR|nr:P-loop containing nucleoside triphosphate hydrolase protein [Lentinula aciculospora]